MLPIESFVAYSKRLGILERIEMFDRIQLPVHFGYRFGFRELAETVAGIHRTLPEADRERCVILANTYAKTCSLDHLGRALDLPPAYGGRNSCWYWLPGDLRGEVVITVGYREEFMRELYRDVHLVETFSHPYVMPWENDQPILLCRDPVEPLHEMWPRFKNF